MLSLSKFGYVGATPIIGNKGLDRIQICGRVMKMHMSLRVFQIFKFSIRPLIVPYMLRRVSERGVNSK